MDDYPRVTEILKATNDPESEARLLRWRKAMEAKGELNDNATSLGTKIHKEIELYIKNDVVGNSEQFKLVYNWLWLQKSNKTLIACEHFIKSHTYKYRGCLDLLFMFNKQACILDWTTSARLKKREFIEHKFLQGAAYAIAVEEQCKIKVPELRVVVLSTKKQTFKAKTDSYRDKWLTRLEQYYNQLNTIDIKAID